MATKTNGKKAGWREIDASTHEAQTRHFTHGGGWAPVSVEMPFDELLRAEDDGISGGETEGAGEYEFAQRKLGVKVFFDFLLARGCTPMDLFRQLAAIGRGLHRAPFAAMTMHEIAMMEGQSPAAHSWRCKVLSGEIALAGMKGSRLPGQKSKAASESYKVCRKGNQNRLGGNKLKAAPPAPASAPPKRRQSSFLRLLQVPSQTKPHTP